MFASPLRSVLLACALCAPLGLASPCAAAGTAGVSTPVVVYGDTYGFLVDTPAGWKQDCEALAENGVCALFYRPGETFQSAPVVLYVNTTEPDSLGLAHAIAHDAAVLREDAPQLLVAEEPPLYARFHREVIVRRFDHAVGPTTTELVGYLAEKPRTILFVASAQTPEDLERARPAFAHLVQSYAWMTDRVAAAR